MKNKKHLIIKIPKVSLSLFFMLSIFFITWILFAFNTKTVDMENYKLFYNTAKNGIRFPGIEIGYYFFIRLCTILGLDFSHYMIVYSFVGVTIIYKSVVKYSDKSGFFSLLLFIFFPYFYLIAAQRFFMATAIVIWSMRYLLYKYKWGNLKFFLTILLASTFHIYSLIALIYFLSRLSDKKINNMLIFSSIFAVIFIFFRDTIFNFVSQFIPKLSYYSNEKTRFETKIFLLFYFITKNLICELHYKYVKQDELLKINKLTLLIFPLAIMSMDFMRIEYTMLIFMSIYIFNISSRKQNSGGIVINYKEVFAIRLLFILFYGFSGYVLLYLYSIDSVVRTILENNSFLNIGG